MQRADVLDRGRDNNFNLIRMVAASTVIVSHSFALSNGPKTWEPLGDQTLGLGAIGVHLFFGLSGFFILKSFVQRASTFGFVVARTARLVPALAAVMLATDLLLRSGVNFADNPFPGVVNGSLWTLWYEVTCYAGLAVAGLCGLYRSGRFPLFLILYALFFAAVKTEALVTSVFYADLSFPFVLGMSAYRYRAKLPLHWAPALFFIALAAAIPVTAIWSFAAVYAALWLGSIPGPFRAYNRLGDYSYGTYILGWPVQQTLAYAIPGIGPFAMMALALPICWSLAALSWHRIELPALEMVRRFTHRPEGPAERSGTIHGGAVPVA